MCKIDIININNMTKSSTKVSTNKVGIAPLGDRILIEIPTREEKTKGGIIIPETVEQDKPEQGKVIAVGDGRVTDSGDVIPVRSEEHTSELQSH